MGVALQLPPCLPQSRSPLDAKRVLVTRPQGQARRLVDALHAEGAIAIEVPAIRIEPPTSWETVDATIRASRYDWVVFTSANGVRFFLDRLNDLGVGLAWLTGAKVAAIGPETARSLHERGVATDLVPDEYVAEALVASIADAAPLAGQRILLPRADIARDALEVGLTEAGALVDKIVAYRTVLAAAPQGLLSQLEAGEIDAVTFTSSSTVRALAGMLDDVSARLSTVTIACIGPITAATAREHGLRPSVVATTYTVDGLVAGLRAFYAESLPVGR